MSHPVLVGVVAYFIIMPAVAVGLGFLLRYRRRQHDAWLESNGQKLP